MRNLFDKDIVQVERKWVIKTFEYCVHVSTINIRVPIIFKFNSPKKLVITIKPCVLDAATSSGILKVKQKLGRTFNSDKLGGIAFQN